MTMEQVSASVQSDGGFSQVEVFDDSDDLYKRIEVFQANQPMDKFGITAAGSTAADICGEAHLSPRSNTVHRNIYSEGQSQDSLTVLFEVVEELNPEGAPDGSWEVRARDLDVNSPAFGEVLIIRIEPCQDGGYDMSYELRDPDAEATLVTSPLDEPVHEAVPDLADIGRDREELGVVSDRIDENPINFSIDESTTGTEVDEALAPLAALRDDRDYRVYIENLESYMAFGDYGPKSVHPGTNLVGEDADKVANYLVWREYRVDMTARGRPFLPGMIGATDGAEGPLTINNGDSKPGVYSLFIMAHQLDISVYELVLDKVYSDYSGVPMERAPGSRLETGADPVVDASRGIETAAEVAETFYLRSNDPGSGSPTEMSVHDEQSEVADD